MREERHGASAHPQRLRPSQLVSLFLPENPSLHPSLFSPLHRSCVVPFNLNLPPDDNLIPLNLDYVSIALLGSQPLRYGVMFILLYCRNFFFN